MADGSEHCENMREQSFKDQMADRIFAAMNTDNFGQACTLHREFKASNEVDANEIRIDVLREFGINLED